MIFLKSTREPGNWYLFYMQAAGRFMNELYLKANVVDNRYLFF